MRYLILSLFTVLLATSCLKNLDPPITTEHYVSFINPEEWLTDNPVSFSNPEIGQISYFAFHRGNQYKNDEVFDEYQYENVVISLEVIGEDENGFLMKEVIQKDSLATLTWYDNDLPIQYYMKIDEDLKELRFYNPDDEDKINSLLLHGTPITLSTETFTNQEVEVRGWKTSLPYCACDQTAFVTNYTQFGTTYDYLNVNIRVSPLGQADDYVYTYLYSAEDGLVRFTYFVNTGAPLSPGTGWDFLGRE